MYAFLVSAVEFGETTTLFVTGSYATALKQIKLRVRLSNKFKNKKNLKKIAEAATLHDINALLSTYFYQIKKHYYYRDKSQSDVENTDDLESNDSEYSDSEYSDSEM